MDIHVTQKDNCRKNIVVYLTSVGVLGGVGAWTGVASPGEYGNSRALGSSGDTVIGTNPLAHDAYLCKMQRGRHK